MFLIDYSYYVSRSGGTLSEEVFSRLIGRACAFIRYVTMGKARMETDAEKLAACAVVEVYAAEEKKGGGEFRSENNDGYSVTYVIEGRDGETREETLSRKAYQAIRPYLLLEGLLYRGVGVSR